MINILTVILTVASIRHKQERFVKYICPLHAFAIRELDLWKYKTISWCLELMFVDIIFECCVVKILATATHISHDMYLRLYKQLLTHKLINLFSYCIFKNSYLNLKLFFRKFIIHRWSSSTFFGWIATQFWRIKSFSGLQFLLYLAVKQELSMHFRYAL